MNTFETLTSELNIWVLRFAIRFLNDLEEPTLPKFFKIAFIMVKKNPALLLKG